MTVKTWRIGEAEAGAEEIQATGNLIETTGGI